MIEVCQVSFQSGQPQFSYSAIAGFPSDWLVVVLLGQTLVVTLLAVTLMKAKLSCWPAGCVLMAVCPLNPQAMGYAVVLAYEQAV
jgi:hypothetical protein